MSVAGSRPVPPLTSSQANRFSFSPELLAAAECLRRLAVRHPGKSFAVPYLSVVWADGTAYYAARLIEYQVHQDGWINYHDVLILHGSREEAEREVRRRKLPGADGILQAEGVLGWSDTVRVYTAALEYLEDSGYLRFSWPDLREQARAALTLARLL
jgi:hypothetical protein